MVPIGTEKTKVPAPTQVRNYRNNYDMPSQLKDNPYEFCGYRYDTCDSTSVNFNTQNCKKNLNAIERPTINQIQNSQKTRVIDPVKYLASWFTKNKDYYLEFDPNEPFIK